MCTARIGKSPAESVVNHEFRVHDVSGIRVIDASVRKSLNFAMLPDSLQKFQVLPSPFPGHTCATVIALAEKASIFLKNTLY